MERLFNLDDDETGYRCKNCYTFVAPATEFRNRILLSVDGRLYIFNRLNSVNVIIAESEKVDDVPRITFSSRFSNAHVACVRGWKYNLKCGECLTLLGLKFIDVELQQDSYCLQRTKLVPSDGIDSPDYGN